MNGSQIVRAGERLPYPSLVSVVVHVDDRHPVSVRVWGDEPRVMVRLHGRDCDDVGGLSLYASRDGIAHLREVLTQALAVLDAESTARATDPTATTAETSTTSDGPAEGGSFPMEGAA